MTLFSVVPIFPCYCSVIEKETKSKQEENITYSTKCQETFALLT